MRLIVACAFTPGFLAKVATVGRTGNLTTKVAKNANNGLKQVLGEFQDVLAP
jgi:hypothetical protein